MLDLLHGIRIVSFNHFLLGPMAIQTLADLGADVISVESPEGAWQRHWSSGDIWHDGQGMLHLCANRNKRSLALDLKAEKGKAVARRLAEGADIVAENFRPGVMEKLGLGYDALRQHNSDLIYASASGYGCDGPYARRPGQDLLAQALFGIMAITGHEAPRPVGVSVVDHHGAALLAMGILAALVRRERTGKGCRVEANLMQAALDLQAESLTAWINAPQRPASVSAPRHVAGWYYPAPYGVYATRDGHIALSLSPLAAVAKALEAPELAALSDQDGWQRQDEISGLIAKKLASKNNTHWCARLETAHIWHAPVQDYDGILNDPQVKHMQALVTVSGAGEKRAPITLVNHPLRYDGNSAAIGLPPQRLGAQTKEVLSEIGYCAGEISTLIEEGVVRVDDV